jgi:hypothetical protein
MDAKSSSATPPRRNTWPNSGSGASVIGGCGDEAVFAGRQRADSSAGPVVVTVTACPSRVRLKARPTNNPEKIDLLFVR